MEKKNEQITDDREIPGGDLGLRGTGFDFRYEHITGRLYYTLVTVAAVAFVWFMNYWNLLGWRY